MITLESLLGSMSKFTWVDAVDILILSIVIYYVLKLASRTRAMNVLRGLGLIIIMAAITRVLRLQGISWLLENLIGAGALIMVVIFQPELRRALEQIGRGKLLEGSRDITAADRAAMQSIIKALTNMSRNKVGAIIVLQKNVALGDIIETGTKIRADVSSQIIESIFTPDTPLHDGAIIIDGTEIIAAGCFLPLSDSPNIPKELGTRHRAALGVSEVSDSLAFVVSEETGQIAFAYEGGLTRDLSTSEIRRMLITSAAQNGTVKTVRSWFSGWRKNNQ